MLIGTIIDGKWRNHPDKVCPKSCQLNKSIKKIHFEVIRNPHDYLQFNFEFGIILFFSTGSTFSISLKLRMAFIFIFKVNFITFISVKQLPSMILFFIRDERLIAHIADKYYYRAKLSDTSLLHGCLNTKHMHSRNALEFSNYYDFCSCNCLTTVLPIS